MSKFGWIRRLGAICLLCYWAVLFLGTHLPGSVSQIKGNDKLLHFTAFSGLSFLLAAVFVGRRLTFRRCLWVLLFLAAYAAVDEWTQSFVPGRHSDVLDWTADVMGGILGVVWYTVFVLNFSDSILARVRSSFDRRATRLGKSPAVPTSETSSETA